MISKKKKVYPGEDSLAPLKTGEIEHTSIYKEEPDWIGQCPNYNKYKRANPEKVLIMYNID